MDIEHNCMGIQRENEGLKAVGIDFRLWIEYHSPQKIWLLQTTARIPSIIIYHCPFCGYKLSED